MIFSELQNNCKKSLINICIVLVCWCMFAITKRNDNNKNSHHEKN